MYAHARNFVGSSATGKFCHQVTWPQSSSKGSMLPESYANTCDVAIMASELLEEDVAMLDEGDGDSCFYPSDFASPPDQLGGGWCMSNIPAGCGSATAVMFPFQQVHHPCSRVGLDPGAFCNSPGGPLDESFGTDNFLTGTDETSDMDDGLLAGGEVVHHGHEENLFPGHDGPGISSSALGTYHVGTVPSRACLPSSASSTSLVTKVDDQEWKDASPTISATCGCGDPTCSEGLPRMASSPVPILSRSGSRKMSRFARDPGSRSAHSVASDKSGGAHSEVFSTATASDLSRSQQSDTSCDNLGLTPPKAREDVCARLGADSDFQMALEDPRANNVTGQAGVLLDDHMVSPEDDYYNFCLDNLEMVGNASRPLSPLPSEVFRAHVQYRDPVMDYPYSSSKRRPPHVRKTSCCSEDKELAHYSCNRPQDHAPPSNSIKREEYATSNQDLGFQGSSSLSNMNMRPCSMPNSNAAPNMAPQPKQARMLRQSLSESSLVLQTGDPRWVAVPSYADLGGSKGAGYGRYGSGMVPSRSCSTLAGGAKLAKMAPTAGSASSQVKAQIQSYTQARMSQREEQPSWVVAPPVPVKQPTSSSCQGLSAFALISRAAAGIVIPGMSPASDPPVRNAEVNLVASVGSAFSKLAGSQAPSNEQVDGGLRLVQILVSCAEAVACRDSRQASSLLLSLRQMASPHGDAMQRVAACFVEGLSVRIYSSPAGYKTSSSTPTPSSASGKAKVGPTERDRQEAFTLLCQSCPYVGFGHYTANRAILEAFAGEDSLHIIDLGMAHGLQWPCLINDLATRSGGKPKSLRITGVGLSAHRLAQAAELLENAARDADITFSFTPVVDTLENVLQAGKVEDTRHKLDLRDGESLAVNSVLQLHCVVKESRGSLNSVLQKIRDLNPKILTLVEQDASHNGPFFMGRFVEALHYYSAIFDSLDAILPRYSTQRVKIEQFHFAEEIRNIVSCEGPARVERHERIDQWRRRMSRAGFQPLPIKSLGDARRWLTNFECPGYTLTDEKGCLVLGWNTKPIIASSSWRC